VRFRDAGLDLVAASAFVRLSRSLLLARAFPLRETRDEVAVTDQDQGREVAVARLYTARQRRDRHVRQYDDARGSPSELAAYTELQGAVDQFAAREASLAWLDRGYESMARKRKNSAGLEKAEGKRARLLEQVRRRLDEGAARASHAGRRRRR
jgi:hypothetical protein